MPFNPLSPTRSDRASCVSYMGMMTPDPTTQRLFFSGLPLNTALPPLAWHTKPVLSSCVLGNKKAYAATTQTDSYRQSCTVNLPFVCSVYVWDISRYSKMPLLKYQRKEPCHRYFSISLRFIIHHHANIFNIYLHSKVVFFSSRDFHFALISVIILI